jgi:hypothetical protein
MVNALVETLGIRCRIYCEDMAVAAIEFLGWGEPEGQEIQ